ncbi:MAG: hypothetical protein ACETV1_04830 [Candidatus Bathyarchaeia archaeon]
MEDNKEKEEELKLDWRDYVAFVIALLETSLLPFVLIMVTLFAIVVISIVVGW